MTAMSNILITIAVVVNSYFGISPKIERNEGNAYSAYILIHTKFGKSYEGSYRCLRGEKCDIELGGKFSIELLNANDQYKVYIYYKGEEFSPLGCCRFSNFKSEIAESGVVENENKKFILYSITDSNLVYIAPKRLAEMTIRFTRIQ
jgi:hypothetical protein